MSKTNSCAVDSAVLSPQAAAADCPPPTTHRVDPDTCFVTRHRFQRCRRLLNLSRPFRGCRLDSDFLRNLRGRTVTATNELRPLAAQGLNSILELDA